MKNPRNQIRAKIFDSRGFLVQEKDDYTQIDLSKLTEDRYLIRYIDDYGFEISHDNYIKVNQKGYILSI